ncbi:hypothetical protein GGR51DRAFT_573546 [Nemania sp. FL0031]|nr:hypothetical protein GGR51DRAFT_573546 [Nemania sp. FL0031]
MSEISESSGTSQASEASQASETSETSETNEASETSEASEGSEGSEDSEDVWNDLESCLDSIKSFGDFATMERYPHAPNPVLQVGGEIIPFPLRDRDAESIKKLSRQAPFGNGEKTVVDVSVRRTWELGIDKFRLMNPAWPPFLDSLLEKVCSNLGIIGTAYAQPHKLLLYEKDSFFLPHKDSQKADRMIATLVICLPSEHEGGEVLLSHADQKQTFNTSELSLFDTTALAWFSDVTHEVKKVVSGHRLVLTYNIIHRDGEKFSAHAFGQQLDRLNNTLAHCVSHDPGFGLKIYPLDHKYSASGLSFSQLKGRDLAVCGSLYELCSQHGLYLLLAHITKERYTQGYEDDDEIILSLKTVKGPNGAEIWNRINYVYNDLLKDPFDRSADSYEEQDPEKVANENPEETYRYHNSTAIICRKPVITRPLRDPKTLPMHINMENMMLMAMQDVEENPDAIGTPGDSLTVLKMMVQFSSYHKPRGINGKIIEWAWKRGHQDLYVKSVASVLNSTAWSSGIEAAAKIINSDIREAEDKTTVEWEKYLGDAVDEVHSLPGLAQNLTDMGKAIADSLKSSFSSWKIATEQKKFESQEKLQLSDSNYIIPRLDNADWLTDCLVPALITRSERALIIRIMNTILARKPEATQASSTDAASTILLSTYQKVAMDFEDLKGREFSYTRANDFVKLLERSLEHGLSSNVTQLLDATWANINAFQKAEALERDVVGSFLHQLGQLLKKYEVAYLDSMRHLFTFFIRQYLYINVPPYPKKLPGWSFKPRGCRWCERCTELDKFLKAEDASEHEFPTLDSYSQQHLKDRLPDSLFQLNTENEIMKVSKREGKDFEAEVKKYDGEVAKFEKPFVELRHEYLKELLGEAVYRDLVMLEGVRNSKGAKELAVAAATTGTKRPADETMKNPKDGKLQRV